jgi:hypothetical protein
VRHQRSESNLEPKQAFKKSFSDKKDGEKRSLFFHRFLWSRLGTQPDPSRSRHREQVPRSFGATGVLGTLSSTSDKVFVGDTERGLFPEGLLLLSDPSAEHLHPVKRLQIRHHIRQQTKKADNSNRSVSKLNDIAGIEHYHRGMKSHLSLAFQLEPG